jgi:hypothetical protein
MTHALKLLPSSQMQTMETWNHSPPEKPLSNLRHIATNGDGHGDSFVSNERATTDSSICKGTLGVTHVSGIGSRASRGAVAEVDIAGSVARLDCFEPRITNLDYKYISAETTARYSEEWLDSDGSNCTSPVLTPSSSTMSLKSLYNETSLDSKSLIQDLAPVFDISSQTDPSDPSSLDLSKNSEQNQIGDVSDEENIIGPATHITTTNRPEADISATTKPIDDLKEICDISSSRQDVKFGVDQIIYRSACSYSTPRWSPDEEIQRAQSRFRRYGRRLSALRLEAQRTPSELCPTTPETAANMGQIQADLVKTWPMLGEKFSWWRYLIAILTKGSSSTIARVESEGASIRYTPGRLVDVAVPRPIRFKLARTPG